MYYISYFDKDGNRITSHAFSIHFDEENKNDVIFEMLKTGDVKYFLELNEEQHALLINKGLIYKDGALVEPPPPPPPSQEEILENRKEEYNQEVNSDLNSSESNLAIMETLAEIMERLDNLEAQ